MLGVVLNARATCYVNTAAAGSGDGMSWPGAFNDLQNALANSECTEIWVAKGVYKPALPTSPDPALSFSVRPGIAIYGGFTGGEEFRDQRNTAANKSILSGDIDGNDVNAATTQIDATSADIRGSNSNHIVIFDGTSALGKIRSNTVLDGFTITGGKAIGMGGTTGMGGGLLCKGAGAGSECSPTLSNLVFTGNSADEGGAMACDGRSGGSDPVLSDVVFSGNSAQTGGAAFFIGTSAAALSRVSFVNNAAVSSGGAMENEGDSENASPLVTDAVFRNNRAGTSGGAVFNYGSVLGTASPAFTNVLFDGNTATFSGGAIYSFGDDGSSSPHLANVTFSGNQAGAQGGAMCGIANNSGMSRPQLVNVTFAGNTADRGGAIYDSGTFGGVSHPQLHNVILWNDMAVTSDPEVANDSATADIDHSILQGECPAASLCTNPVDGDPLLKKLGNYGGFAPAFLPDVGSAAIDAGDENVCPATDQRGLPRLDGHCDIGAVERQAREDVLFADGFDPL